MNPTTHHGAVGGKYLSFQLADQAYALPILQVREIIGMAPVTVLPRTPDHVLGVVNLRGRIVPVIDLRRRFGIERSEPTSATCIIVVEVEGGSDAAFRVGCVVDSVSEVTAIDDDQVEPAPRCVDDSTDCVAGLATIDERVLILLDSERVLGDLDPAALGKEPVA